MPHRVWPPNGDLSDAILQQFPYGYIGHAVDVGASDGISVNTTWKLEKFHHWTVLSVEPNPEFADALHRQRAFVEMCACGSEPMDEATFHIHADNPEAYSALKIANHPRQHAKQGAQWRTVMVPVRTIEQLLAKWDFPRLDALCVDVEGTELDVLKGCDLGKWKPKVVVVECWDKTGPAHEYLKERGYRCVDTSVHNHVYLREGR